MQNLESERVPTGLEVAVIGMAARFPGANSLQQFWNNIVNGVESIQTLTDDELLSSGVPAQLLAQENYVRRSVVLDEYDRFDAGFFGINPREAALMDPQHRLFLECGWHALENAGYDPWACEGAVGVFGGSGYNAYLSQNLLANAEIVRTTDFFLLRHMGNDKDFLTTRLSYELNLTGPSVNVQTACSTSLVAIHVACQSLINGECDVALAGGVTIELPHSRGYLYKPGEIFSPDGHCRPFDQNSRGTVFGSGAGIIVLKRLEQAQRDGDRIRAVILGSAVNNDGATKAGYLAPSVEGQTKAVAEAIAVAGIAADSVTMLEAHGTGTPIGDPIEVTALSQAYGKQGDRKQYCAIGSVKANIGHLDTAAGVAGVIKSILALEHRTIPPLTNFQGPNPEIDFEASPFYISRKAQEWSVPQGTPRRVAVNSLGVGGTNAHVILEEPAPVAKSDPGRSADLLLLSARSEDALIATIDNYVDYLSSADESLADIAYTTRVGRHAFAHRRAVVCRDVGEALANLELDQAPLELSGVVEGDPPHVVFMFPGQGAQYVNMAAELYRQERVYREVIDECCEILRPLLGFNLWDRICCDGGDLDEVAAQLKQTDTTQPALFVVSLALAELLMSYGITPAAMIGHSIGEYVAACLAGVFGRREALHLVARRGALMQSMPTGAMLAVLGSLEETTKRLIDGVEVATVNGPGITVVAGSHGAIEQFQAVLASQHVDFRRLHTSHAFHSAAMEPILPPFAAEVAKYALHAPKIPFISNTTGEWITDDQATNPAYWAEHIRRPVLFAPGVSTMLAAEERLFLLEVGPGDTLTQLVKPLIRSLENCRACHTLPRPLAGAGADQQTLLNALAQLWVAGANVEWPQLFAGDARQRVPIPGYPFARQRHWIAPDHSPQVHLAPSESERSEASKAVGLGRYESVWVKSDEPLSSGTASADEPERVLLVTEGSRDAELLQEKLRQLGHSVVVASTDRGLQGEVVADLKGDLLTPDGCEIMLETLGRYSWVPRTIVMLSSWNGPRECVGDAQEFYDSHGLWQPIALCQAMANLGWNEPQRLVLVVAGGVTRDVSQPLAALALGPTMVVPREFPQLKCQIVDIPFGELGASMLAQEIHEPREGDMVTYLDGVRHRRVLQPVREDETPDREVPVRRKGVYLVTGGLGDLGLAAAESLASQVPVRLVLVGRSGFPGQHQWDALLQSSGEQSWIGGRIVRLRQLIDQGCELQIAAADVSNLEEMRQLLSSVRAQWGALNGVIHAAGELDDGLVLSKKLDSMRQVLRPKVAGTLVLDQLLAEESLDFFVLYSSLSAALGVAGQVDYSAANAFLDAYARYRACKSNWPVVAVGWGPWQEVGMTARLAEGDERFLPPGVHPLLQQQLQRSAQAEVFETKLSAEDFWVLQEHRLRAGQAVLPGTAFIEMVRASVTQLAEHRAVEIADAMFMSPFVLEPGGSKAIRVQLTKRARGTDFAVISPEGDEGHWFVHLKGRVRSRGGESPVPVNAPVNIHALRDRCRGKRLTNPGNEQIPFLNFGARWNCLRQVQLGTDEAVLDLELPAAHVEDLAKFGAHPALLDVGLAGALKLTGDFEPTTDFYVPVAFRSLIFWRPFTQRLVSHIRYRPELSTPRDFAVFDITIMQPDGEIVATAMEFMLKRLDDPSVLLMNVGSVSARHMALPVPKPKSPSQSLRERLQSMGVPPSEGASMLMRVIAHPRPPAYLVSPVSPEDIESSLGQVGASPQGANAAAGTAEAAANVGRIEAALVGHRAIQRAAVVISMGRQGETRVGAYFERVRGSSATVSEIRRFVRGLLPSHEVPSIFI
jgi:acyl transferase domain-containing protein